MSLISTRQLSQTHSECDLFLFFCQCRRRVWENEPTAPRSAVWMIFLNPSTVDLKTTRRKKSKRKTDASWAFFPFIPHKFLSHHDESWVVAFRIISSSLDEFLKQCTHQSINHHCPTLVSVSQQPNIQKSVVFSKKTIQKGSLLSSVRIFLYIFDLKMLLSFEIFKNIYLDVLKTFPPRKNSHNLTKKTQPHQKSFFSPKR